MHPDIYEHELTVPARTPVRIDWCPRELTRPRWQWFFDERAAPLELTSVMVGNSENLVQPVPAAIFVYSLPSLVLESVRAPLRATLAIYNPTEESRRFNVWIGEWSALLVKLAKLGKATQV